MSEQTSPEPQSFGWTTPQRRALLLLLSVLCVGLAVRYLTNPVYVSDPQPPRPANYDQLADRIDPNTADLATLTAVPQIGEKRAQAILDFRNRQAARRPEELPFKVVEDLLAVPGFGPAMVENVRPYFVFPPRPGAATRP